MHFRISSTRPHVRICRGESNSPPFSRHTELRWVTPPNGPQPQTPGPFSGPHTNAGNRTQFSRSASCAIRRRTRSCKPVVDEPLRGAVGKKLGALHCWECAEQSFRAVSRHAQVRLISIGALYFPPHFPLPIAERGETPALLVPGLTQGSMAHRQCAAPDKGCPVAR